MERGATQSNKGNGKHGQSFQPVYDSRKREIPGLWMRGSRYYAQLRVDLDNGHTAPRRLALEASNLDEAKGGVGAQAHRAARRQASPAWPAADL